MMRCFLLFICLGSFFTFGQSDFILSDLDSSKGDYAKVAMQIWEYAEMGYQEEKSTALLQSKLKEAGFSVLSGVAGIPTAFIAEYNNGGPVIGILGEFDALPGLAQTKSPFKEVADNNTGAGHACGHHLFGAASAWAAVTIKQWIEQNNIQSQY